MLFKSVNPSQPTICVVVPFFWTGRSLKLLLGIRDAAEYFKTNMIFFQGYYCNQAYYYTYRINDDTFEEAGNQIFELIDKKLIDGLIVNTGGFRAHSQKMRLMEYCKKYNPLPIISVGSAIEGVSNILIDNTRGTRKMMNHLIKHHNFRRIAIIQGPEGHYDSSMRMKTYLDVLKENAIELNPLWIGEHGTWSNEWVGPEAIKILERCNYEIDAIVCMNDGHARAIIETFNPRGIKVPQQIAVVGFNNEPDAFACRPPITTVDLNLYDRGWYAVKALSEYVNGKPLADAYTVNAPIILRQSCGCSTPGSRAIDECANQGGEPSAATATRNELLSQMKLDIMNTLCIPDSKRASELSENFIALFSQQLASPDQNRFVNEFSRMLRFFSKDFSDISSWYLAINVISIQIDKLVPPSIRASALRLVDIARILVSEVAVGEQKEFVTKVLERNATMNSLTQFFNKSNDLTLIIETLATYLPQMGIPACYLSLYENHNNPMEQARLVLAYNKDGRILLPSGGIVFPTNQLVPENIISVEQFKPLIIEPLFYGNRQLGFTLFEFGSQEKSFYELFPAQLSASLWGSILYKKEQHTEAVLSEQAQKLAHANEKLRERAADLKSAYDLLSKDQENLFFSEKMASLGRLTASIAHEMNTPLAAVRASLMELKKLSKEYQTSINDPDITAEDHTEIASEILQAVVLADKSAKQAGDFIQSIKVQTRDITKKETETFSIVDILNSVITFLKPSLKTSTCTVSVVPATDRVRITGSPSKMTRVFTNIITNAIDASVNAADKTIIVSISESDNQLVIDITDHGCGIAPENLSKIYDPMFSTKPFVQSSGLGLSIVHDIILHDFNGSVSVKSDLGKGTTLTFLLPISH